MRQASRQADLRHGSVLVSPQPHWIASSACDRCPPSCTWSGYLFASVASSHRFTRTCHAGGQRTIIPVYSVTITYGVPHQSLLSRPCQREYTPQMLAKILGEAAGDGDPRPAVPTDSGQLPLDACDDAVCPHASPMRPAGTSTRESPRNRFVREPCGACVLTRAVVSWVSKRLPGTWTTPARDTKKSRRSKPGGARHQRSSR